AGTLTNFGGFLMDDEVLEAMKKTSKSFVDMDELLKESGECLAYLLDAEAVLVTCGAAAGDDPASYPFSAQ
ncbi:hypothetical protein KGY64_04630, partial [Candidatus Bipolaricaulota bacterium]|nr:hypothetical protein [Candidatus Bipolaricaulota bacterium]